MTELLKLCFKLRIKNYFKLCYICRSFNYVQSETIKLIQNAEYSIQQKLQKESLKTAMLEKTIDQNDYLIKQIQMKNSELENENHTLKERIEQTENKVNEVIT